MALNQLLAGLIVVATVAFAIGITLERSETHSEPGAEVQVGVATEGSSATETAEGGGPVTEVPAESHGGGSEEVLGIGVESTPFVALAVIFSVGLAAGVWFRPDLRPLVILIVAAMIVFMVLDVREIFHQLDESKQGVALLAGVIAFLHAASAGVAVRLLRRGTGEPGP